MAEKIFFFSFEPNIYTAPTPSHCRTIPVECQNAAYLHVLFKSYVCTKFQLNRCINGRKNIFFSFEPNIYTAPTPYHCRTITVECQNAAFLHVLLKSYVCTKFQLNRCINGRKNIFFSFEPNIYTAPTTYHCRTITVEC